MDRLSECMEELLCFTLNSHISQALDSNLGLSSQFCSDLLREANDVVTVSTDVDLNQNLLKGVPLYPLYKRIASALVRSVSCRAFCLTNNDSVVLVHEDGLQKEREEAWSELVLNMGAELVNFVGVDTIQLKSNPRLGLNKSILRWSCDLVAQLKTD